MNKGFLGRGFIVAFLATCGMILLASCATEEKARPLWPLSESLERQLWEELALGGSGGEIQDRELFDLFLQPHPHIPTVEGKLRERIEKGEERTLEHLLPKTVQLLQARLLHDLRSVFSKRRFREARGWIEPELQRRLMLDYGFELLTYQLGQGDSAPISKQQLDQLPARVALVLKNWVFPLEAKLSQLRVQKLLKTSFESEELLLEFLSGLYPDYENGPLVTDPTLVKLFFNDDFSLWLREQSRGGPGDIEQAIAELRSAQENRTLSEIGEF